ncbi:MAG: archease [bacterium]
MDRDPRERPPFEELEHTADVGIRAYGTDLEEIFRNAARGMFKLIRGEMEVEPETERSFELEEEDTESLLVAFLSELNYLSETEGLIFTDFHLSIHQGRRLEAVCRGGPFGDEREELGMEIKAVTWHQLAIDREEGWARVIFDV